jgi:hypothetical protein
MNSKKLFFVMISLVGLMAIGLIGGAYGASSILTEQSKSLLDARSKSMALDQQQIQLNNAKASIKKYQDVSNIASSVVPQDKDQAQTVLEIVKIASQQGIKLGAITFPSSTLGGTTTGSSSSSSSSTSASSTSNSSASKLSQLTPVKGITGVYTLPITVQSDSASPTSYDKFISFMSALEHNRRTALVSAINLQPDPKDPAKVGFTLTIDEYIKPQ